MLRVRGVGRPKMSLMIPHSVGAGASPKSVWLIQLFGGGGGV